MWRSSGELWVWPSPGKTTASRKRGQEAKGPVSLRGQARALAQRVSTDPCDQQVWFCACSEYKARSKLFTVSLQGYKGQEGRAHVCLVPCHVCGSHHRLHTVHTFLNEYMNFCSLIPKFTTQVLSHPHWKQECLVMDCECVTNVHALMSARQDWGPSSTKDQLVSQVEKLVPVASQMFLMQHSHLKGCGLPYRRRQAQRALNVAKVAPFMGFAKLSTDLLLQDCIMGTKSPEQRPLSLSPLVSELPRTRSLGWGTGLLQASFTWNIILHGELPGDRWHSVPWSSSHLGIVTPRS